MADAGDLKSLARKGRVGSTPTSASEVFSLNRTLITILITKPLFFLSQNVIIFCDKCDILPVFKGVQKWSKEALKQVI